MNTCKTCKWWDTEPRNVNLSLHRDCLSEKLQPGNDADGEPDTLGYYNEGSKFWSGPDFGCIHHEPREEHHASY